RMMPEASSFLTRSIMLAGEMPTVWASMALVILESDWSCSRMARSMASKRTRALARRRVLVEDCDAGWAVSVAMGGSGAEEWTIGCIFDDGTTESKNNIRP